MTDSAEGGLATVDAEAPSVPHAEESDYRILLVDDEAGIRNSLATYLDNAGFDVATAENAMVARELLSSRSFHLVLTDISMPEVSGLDLLADIKALDEEIEVIMITAYLDISLAIQAMRRGAYDFFTKPFNYEKILLTIQRVQEKHELKTQARQYEILKRKQEFEEQAVLETTLGLARAVEERDRYNIGHGKRCARFACMIGESLDFAPERLRFLHYAGLLHDVGKIGIDDKILNKPDRLSDDEFSAIKRHPEIGEYILTPISFLSNIARVVRHHHERWDGGGYPDGLSGEEIPLEARILSIADIFDSVTSSRPYRNPMATDAALELLIQEREKALDPMLTDLFIERMDRAPRAVFSPARPD